ncbi:hypothetical protein GCK72_012870 [Caenorhabditis remanei]|uniref:Uncharacterized protein n=1 Tax=Caenorhabditis remanei TaxID=31234 RepID=A0A6A5GMA0_CAERE|nr:hypothetical protein GCK72_012870 [Caenorhabditis remanei]KAF1756417.1 hypothetical protein GCK72_012870 [Caenorhabditis remanei]
MGDVGEVEFLGESFPDTPYLASCLEVSGGIVGLRDEDLRLGSQVAWLVDIRNLDEFLGDLTEKLESWKDLSLWVGRLDGGRHHCQVPSLRVTSDLLLWDDNLTRLSIVGVWNRVIQQADGTNDLSGLLDTILGVRWITIDLLSTNNLISTLHSNRLSILNDNLVDWLVKHISSSVDCGETSESLWKFSQSVEWIQVWRLSVTSQRVRVQTNLLDSRCEWLILVLIVTVESKRVSGEVGGVLIKSELLVDLLHRLVVWIQSLPRLRLVLIELLNPDEELLEATLLEHSHEGSGKSLHLIGWHLVDLSAFHDERRLDRLEFQVTSDTGMDEKLDERSVGHQEFWDQVDVPVTSTTHLRLWLRLSSVEFLVELLKWIDLGRFHPRPFVDDRVELQTLNRLNTASRVFEIRGHLRRGDELLPVVDSWWNDSEDVLEMIGFFFAEILSKPTSANQIAATLLKNVRFIVVMKTGAPGRANAPTELMKLGKSATCSTISDAMTPSNAGRTRRSWNIIPLPYRFLRRINSSHIESTSSQRNRQKTPAASNVDYASWTGALSFSNIIHNPWYTNSIKRVKSTERPGRISPFSGHLSEFFDFFRIDRNRRRGGRRVESIEILDESGGTSSWQHLATV